MKILNNACKILLFSIFMTTLLHAEVKLPGIFSDHMVIQRNQPIKIWGSAAKGEKITISIDGHKANAVAGKTGTWQVTLPPLAQGGPLQLVVKGKNTITLNDILIGDVWVCSGQSNMDFSLSSAKNVANELKDADIKGIRLFSVPQETSDIPETDMKSVSWKVCSAEVAKNFSAVAYFFGKNLNKELNVPIGLIQTSWGGTGIQTWMSKDALSAYPKYQGKIEELSKIDYQQVNRTKEQRQKEWNDTLSLYEPGVTQKWNMPELSDKDWTSINIPNSWESLGVKGEGVGWFRKEFFLTEEQASGNGILNLGHVSQTDETFLNGIKVGENRSENRSSIYPVCQGMLKSGRNVLAVKVCNLWDTGAFQSPTDQIYLKTNNARILLSGAWKFKKGYFSPNPALTYSPNSYPTLLFNAMVSPLINFPVKGVIWYQGEQNTDNPKEYRELLPAMINDWRQKWNVGDFPFLIVQLPNIMNPDEFPTDHNWGEFREAQAAAMAIHNTGIAVTIDVGEADDIHPKNKQDVGFRLALAARKIAYGEDVVFSGPTYKSFTVEGNKVAIEFDNLEKGLITSDKYGFVKGFALADTDQQFYWAKAFLEGNKVIVYTENVVTPVAIRYAWSNNPDATLYNGEKLPAVPFRTDNW